ncbi:phosphatidylserine decarboxylase [Hylemonella gracilis str. Niagara R]|uniref:phosphatidylserine decarboxylase n=1 Tax=Hylemonella gracilis str. Niagara R TaxID=1458275 RepID=A0A016XJ04_9BURK|nr:archaetidylserine decarboxylase [Hylemonella gracilis]EYC51841.1 phosphatidylserine decarboxylase [Hylemonella gracilis str. Niagara R]
MNVIHRLLQQESLNFVLTNRLPRVALTRFMGRFAQIRNPLVRVPSIAAFKFFARPDLGEAKQQKFGSLRDCFVRELKDGARPFDADPHVVCAPSDGIIGGHGRIQGDELLQIKGMPYSLTELLGNDAAAAQLAQQHQGGSYVTLRLRAGMYHRFHAPADCRVRRVTHIQGDAWNVNPIALKRVKSLYCRNDRAVIEAELPTGLQLTLVPVGAILVASVRLHFLDLNLHHDYAGPQVLSCDAVLQRGQEMGWFEHGSTIVVLAPPGLALVEGLATGSEVRAGQGLLRQV